MNRLSQPLASAGLLATIALATIALAGCSDDPRIPDGERFTRAVTGVPGVVLIDNMEDGTQYLLSDDGLTGLWYTYSDESVGSTQEPAIGFPMYRILQEDGDPEPSSAVPPRPCGGGADAPFFAGETTDDCAFVARTWGAGQRGWGAGMGLDLNGEGGVKNPYDASQFGGIGFFAIGNVRGRSLRVNVQDARTTPESAAAADRRGIQRCESPSQPAGRCNDHFGAIVEVTDTWKWIEIPFSCMQSGGWGFPGAGELLTSAVVGVQFQIQGPDPADSGVLPMGATPMPFDFSIDNLAFIEVSRLANPPACPLAPRL